MRELENLTNLCDTNGLSENDSAEFARRYLANLTSAVSIDLSGNIFARWQGKSDYTIMLDAHIDKIGFVVTGITEDGFIKVSPCGGIDYRTIAAQEVIIYGSEPILGVISTLPPHLVKEEEKPIEKDKIYVDIGLSKPEAENKISLGDFAAFKTRLAQMANELVTSSALDDRAGVASLLSVAKLISSVQALPCNVVIMLSNAEELGCRGAIPGAFEASPDEAIAVDGSFGDVYNVSLGESGKVGKGPMIGISPTLNTKITDKLINLAEENGISYQREVMAGKTGTNADVIGISKGGIPSGLISIPLRNMHTPVEVVSLDDVKNAGRLIFKYVMSGGQSNA